MTWHLLTLSKRPFERSRFVLGTSAAAVGACLLTFARMRRAFKASRPHRWRRGLVVIY